MSPQKAPEHWFATESKSMLFRIMSALLIGVIFWTVNVVAGNNKDNKSQDTKIQMIELQQKDQKADLEKLSSTVESLTGTVIILNESVKQLTDITKETKLEIKEGLRNRDEYNAKDKALLERAIKALEKAEK